MGISHSLLVGIKDGTVTLDGILTISCKSENMTSAQVQGLDVPSMQLNRKKKIRIKHNLYSYKSQWLQPHLSSQMESSWGSRHGYWEPTPRWTEKLWWGQCEPPEKYFLHTHTLVSRTVNWPTKSWTHTWWWALKMQRFSLNSKSSSWGRWEPLTQPLIPSSPYTISTGNTSGENCCRAWYGTGLARGSGCEDLDWSWMLRLRQTSCLKSAGVHSKGFLRGFAGAQRTLRWITKEWGFTGRVINAKVS